MNEVSSLTFSRSFTIEYNGDESTTIGISCRTELNIRPVIHLHGWLHRNSRDFVESV
jgi:hypothetical protein